MQRVAGNNVYGTQPPSRTPANTPGYFGPGVPAAGQGSTQVTYEWANSVQEELISAITVAGISLDVQQHSQLLQAIRNLGGEAVWNSKQNYTPPCLKFGADGKLYVALLSSGPSVADIGPKDPTDSNNKMYWLDYKKGDGLISGSIVAFSGTFGGPNNRHPIPRGETEPDLTYILCDGGSDGKGGTVPDLRGRMLLGADESHPTGSTGGALTHSHSFTGTVGETTLTVGQIASHNHPMPRNNPAQVNGRCYYPSVDSAAYTTTTDASGGSGSHTHGLTASSVTASGLPPYYALSYVIRIT